jgi:hypothetical protein
MGKLRRRTDFGRTVGSTGQFPAGISTLTKSGAIAFDRTELKARGYPADRGRNQDHHDGNLNPGGARVIAIFSRFNESGFLCLRAAANAPGCVNLPEASSSVPSGAAAGSGQSIFSPVRPESIPSRNCEAVLPCDAMPGQLAG